MLHDHYFHGLRNRKIIGTISILGYLMIQGFSQIPVNQPPKVSITQPPEYSIYPRQTQVRYRILVSDPEDGESVYQEIADKTVFLEILYQSGEPPPRQQPLKPFPDDQALDRMKKNHCFTCHSLKGPFTGPSFASIADRYRHDPAGKQAAARRIIEGSRSIWGDPVMPGTPAVSPAEAQAMIAWITQNADRSDYQLIPGLEGSVTIDPPEDLLQGHLLLLASYLDQGVDGHPGHYQKGTDIRIIKFQ